MQIAKSSREELLRPLQTVSGVVDRNPTLPIMANVLIRKSAGKIGVVGTDIEVQIRSTTDSGVGPADLSTTVGGRKLLDILRAAPDGDVVLSLANRKLTVQAGRSRFQLQAMEPENFPSMDECEFKSRLTLPAASLKKMLAMVQPAMAAGDVRYYLNGTLLVIDGTVMRAVATDSQRLAFYEAALAEPAGAVKGIIPRKAVAEIVKLLPDDDEAVCLDLGDRHFRVAVGNTEVTGKLIDGTFPHYSRVMPTNNDKIVDVDRRAFAAALMRAEILAGQKFKVVRLGLEAGTLRIRTANEQDEEAYEELEARYAGAPLEIAFSVRFLLDALTNLADDTVRIAFKDALSAAVLSVPGSNAFLYVVMPVRL